MNEHIAAFLKQLSEDQALQEKMNQVKNPDEAYALASSVQGGFTKDEFVETMTKLAAAIKEKDELSDEDLAKTAGGIELDGYEGLAAIGGALIGFFGAGAAAIVAS